MPSGPPPRAPRRSRSPSPGARNGTRGRPQAAPHPHPCSNRLRAAGLPMRFSTETWRTGCPHPGDTGVVPTLSTAQARAQRSVQLSRLGICGQSASTDCGQHGYPRCPFRGCPPPTHRLTGVVHSEGPLLHICVHCSATRSSPSPARVKGVTPRWWVGLGRTRVFLGMQLGRTPGYL